MNKVEIHLRGCMKIVYIIDLFPFQPQGNAQFLFNHFTQITNSARWIVKNVTIPPQQHSFNIIMEAVIGTGNSGDMAIDDVKLHTGSCI